MNDQPNTNLQPPVSAQDAADEARLEEAMQRLNLLHVKVPPVFLIQGPKCRYADLAVVSGPDASRYYSAYDRPARTEAALTYETPSHPVAVLSLN